jgi:translation initiation factor 3 subunit C
MKINDWSSIQTLFDELNKRLDKIHKVPGSTGPEPRMYIKLLVELEVSV